jgi:hypothetical protein
MKEQMTAEKSNLKSDYLMEYHEMLRQNNCLPDHYQNYLRIHRVIVCAKQDSTKYNKHIDQSSNESMCTYT